MQVREITDKHIWENFLLRCPKRTFFQSWNWGDFRQASREKIWRFGVYDREQLIAVALTSKKVARRGTYLEIAHGPSLVEVVHRKEALETLLERLREMARQEGASFVRINPLWEGSPQNNAVLRNLGFRGAPMYTTYESTWKLDITPAEEELLKNMRKAARYLIRQNLKNEDITIRQGLETGDLEEFHKLSRAVGERQKFIPFSKKDTEQEIAALQKDNQVSLIFGLYKGKPVAAALAVFWAGIGFYHQGASLGEYAKLSVPYLVQWEAIREAKRRGCALYDFWGFVDPQKYPKHPWAGPTLFKMGFGGQAFEYVKTQDYPVSWKYWPTWIFETTRKKRRRL